MSEKAGPKDAEKDQTELEVEFWLLTGGLGPILGFTEILDRVKETVLRLFDGKNSNCAVEDETAGTAEYSTTGDLVGSSCGGVEPRHVRG